MLAPMKVKMGMMLCRTFSCRTNRRHEASKKKHTQRNVLCPMLNLTHREDGGGGAQQQQSVVVSLRHVGRSDTLNHQLHTELIFIQNICTGKPHHRDV